MIKIIKIDEERILSQLGMKKESRFILGPMGFCRCFTIIFIWLKKCESLCHPHNNNNTHLRKIARVSLLYNLYLVTLNPLKLNYFSSI